MENAAVIKYKYDICIFFNFFSMLFFTYFKVTQYYVPNANDCAPKGIFGTFCSADNECLSTLACDIQPIGLQTSKCLYLNGSLCITNSDCANNLDCINNSCGCSVTKFFFNLNSFKTFKKILFDTYFENA